MKPHSPGQNQGVEAGPPEPSLLQPVAVQLGRDFVNWMKSFTDID